MTKDNEFIDSEYIALTAAFIYSILPLAVFFGRNIDSRQLQHFSSLFLDYIFMYNGLKISKPKILFLRNCTDDVCNVQADIPDWNDSHALHIPIF